MNPTETEHSEKTRDILFPGFSERYNRLLDLTEQFPPIEYGRKSAIAKYFDASKNAAADWLDKNRPPIEKTLRHHITVLANLIPGRFDIMHIEAWLRYGSEIVDDPFIGFERTSIDHILMAMVYEYVDKTSLELKIDLESLSRSAADKLYQTVYDRFKNRKIKSIHDISQSDTVVVQYELVQGVGVPKNL